MRVKRQIRIEGDIAFVPLTKGYEAVIDAADVPLVEGVNWYAMPHGRTVYARRSDYSTGRCRGVFMHQTVAGGAGPDHKDGNGLNCRRGNLRAASLEENARNARKRSDNSSGLKGAFRNGKKWRAAIRVSGRLKYLGLFGCATAAHLAYRKASEKLHGEFGRLD